MDLEKCVCVIVGGVQGVGKRIAEKLLEEGCRVIIADNDEVRVEAFLNEAYQNDVPDDQVKFLKCDNCDTTAIEQLLAQAKAWHGHINIVCHVGGSVGRDPGEARRVLEWSIETCVAGTYKAIDIMSKQRGGKGGLVVNICSMTGARVDQVAASYTTAETGVIVAFTRSFGLFPHSADDGVRVNCVCPSSCGETKALRTVWERRPSNQEYVSKEGSVSEKSVVNAFMSCVRDDSMNGNVLAIIPPDNIVQA